MKIRARITLTVECIRGYIFIFLFYVEIQLRVMIKTNVFSILLIFRHTASTTASTASTGWNGWNGFKRRLVNTSGTTSGTTTNTTDGSLSLSDNEVAYAYAANGNTNAMCRFGYEGPMCNKCIDGYWKTPADTCERCKTAGEDSQRGNDELQLLIYMGGGGAAMLFFLMGLAIYLRQDNGRCCKMPRCCVKICGHNCVHVKTCCKSKGKDGTKVTPGGAATKTNQSKSLEEKLANRWFRPEKFKILLR